MESSSSVIKSHIKLEFSRQEEGKQKEKFITSELAIEVQIYQTRNTARELIEGMKVETIWIEKEDFFDIIKDLKSFGKSLDSRGKPAALLEALMTKPGELVSVKDLNFKLHQSTSSYLNSRIKRFNESSIHRPIELVLQTKPNAMRLTFKIKKQKLMEDENSESLKNSQG